MLGDALLIKVTDTMVAACRPEDFVAQLDGDEFCVFLKGCDLERGWAGGAPLFASSGGGKCGVCPTLSDC